MARILNSKFWELFKFCFVGGVMTLLNLALLALLVEKLHMNYLLGNVIAYIIVVVLSYFINFFITFKQEKLLFNEQLIKLFKYLIMKLILLGLDSICLYLLVDKLNINLYVSKIILTLIFTVLSFSFSKTIMVGEKNGNNSI